METAKIIIQASQTDSPSNSAYRAVEHSDGQPRLRLEIGKAINIKPLRNLFKATGLWCINPYKGSILEKQTFLERYTISTPSNRWILCCEAASSAKSACKLKNTTSAVGLGAAVAEYCRKSPLNPSLKAW
jgi:hypothetical protein